MLVKKKKTYQNKELCLILWLSTSSLAKKKKLMESKTMCNLKATKRDLTQTSKLRTLHTDISLCHCCP